MPMTLSNLTVPLVGLVSTAVVGHLPHAYQLGAVAVGTSIYTVLAALAGTLRMGVTGFTAQAQGQNDGPAMHRICLQSIILGLVFAALLGLIALPASNYILGLMQASSALEELGKTYLHIRLLGLPAIMIQQALVGWFLGTQNARAPLAIMITTNLFNILLLFGLVNGLGWGVVGAALASVAAEYLGALLALVLLWFKLRHSAHKIVWRELKQGASWRPLLQANRDIFIRTLLLQAVFLALNLRSANLGDAVVAANAVLLNGLMLCAYVLDGLAHAIEALCGLAIGARKRLELRRALIVAGIWSFVISLAFSLGFVLFGREFIALQTDIPQVRSTALTYIPYLAILPVIAVWSYLLDGLFIGATQALAMRNTMLISVLISLPVALALAQLGNHGLWLALLFFMLVRALAMLVAGRRIYASAIPATRPTQQCIGI